MTRLHRLTITPAQLNTPFLQLTREQRHYLCHVLRLGEGDPFIALTGQGQAWLVQLNPDRDRAEILKPLAASNELRIPVNLCIAILKHNALELVIQASTELGVNRIYPVITERSLPSPSESKLNRWQRIAQEATEQCQRLYIPRIEPPQAWADVVKLAGASSQKFLSSVATESPALISQLSLHSEHSSQAQEIWLAIGPEGGWTPVEMHLAAEYSWQSVSLGQRTLRAVTAAIVGLGLIAATAESWC